MKTPGKSLTGSANRLPMSARVLLLGAFVATISACGGGGGGDGPVLANCKRGLISGFGAEPGDQPIGSVQPQQGESGDGGDGSVGGGEGIGIGGADGQYKNVDVTIELNNGTRFGPWKVDETNGMVTYVHCGDAFLPAKISFEGKSADASYYDEGLQRDVSFTGKSRIGLMSDYEKNVGVTPFSHALYERAVKIGADRNLADGWKNADIVRQAHDELLRVVNDQLPGIYRLKDLRRLPIALDSTKDQPGSASLPDNQNGIFGSVVGGFALSAATTLPASGQPALDLADTLIKDLADAQLDMTDVNGQSLLSTQSVPYTLDTLWQSASVGTGELARRNGRDALATRNTPIGYVRSKAADGSAAGSVTETEYVLGSNGDLITNLNPEVNGGTAENPDPGSTYSALYRFGRQPVVALRRDGKGLRVFPTSADGSRSFQVAAPNAAVTIVDMFDAGEPIVRTSDGSLFRINGSTLERQAAPVGTLNFVCRNEYAGALNNPNDPLLGAVTDRVCYGSDVGNQARVWRNDGSAAGRGFAFDRIKQVSGNEQITLALLADGSLYQLDRDHAVQFRDGAGNLVETLAGGETRELVAAGAPALQIDTPARMCFIHAPFAIDCEGSAYQIDYREYLNPDGSFQGAGPITGLRRLPIPAPVWRPRANRRVTSGDVLLGDDAVFIGVDGIPYDIAGKPVEVPLEGAPSLDPDQPPAQPVLGTVAGDNRIDRAEAGSPLVVTGFAEPGSTVRTQLAGQIQETTAGSDGRWQVTYPIEAIPTQDGPVVMTVVAINPNGQSLPATRNLEVFRALPAQPTIDPVTGDNEVSAQERAGNVQITGGGAAGLTVNVLWGSASKQTTATGDGRWSVSFLPGEVPPVGDSRVSASVSNANGAGPSAGQTVTILQGPPDKPGIADVTGDNLIDQTERSTGVTVTGSGTPGSTVTVNWQGIVKTADVNDSGWAVSFSANEIPQPGETTITASASSPGGQSEENKLAVRVEAPPVVAPARPILGPVAGNDIVDDTEGVNELVIYGSAEGGTQIEVIWGNASFKAKPTDSQGAWSVAIPGGSIPPAGETVISVTASRSGVLSEVLQRDILILDRTGKITIDPITGDDDVNNADIDNGVNLTGTGRPGETLNVSVPGAYYDDPLVVVAVVNERGQWSAFFPYDNWLYLDSSPSVFVVPDPDDGRKTSRSFTSSVVVA